MDRIRNKLKNRDPKPYQTDYKLNPIESDSESENKFEMTLGTGTGLTQQTVDDIIAKALTDNNKLIQKSFLEQEARYKHEIDKLEGLLSSVGINNSITEYATQTIDPTITCNEPLDVIKSLPEFSGSQTSYVSWREAAHNSIALYDIGSKKYFAALTIFRNKITQHANDILTNHGTVLNFNAIISRLDFAYADKRPVHVIEQELSILRQGSMSLIDYYNTVNQKLTLLTNKTIMTHGSNSPVTLELNTIH